jgi:hypothetical protein
MLIKNPSSFKYIVAPWLKNDNDIVEHVIDIPNISLYQMMNDLTASLNSRRWPIFKTIQNQRLQLDAERVHWIKEQIIQLGLTADEMAKTKAAILFSQEAIMFLIENRRVEFQLVIQRNKLALERERYEHWAYILNLQTSVSREAELLEQEKQKTLDMIAARDREWERLIIEKNRSAAEIEIMKKDAETRHERERVLTAQEREKIRDMRLYRYKEVIEIKIMHDKARQEAKLAEMNLKHEEAKLQSAYASNKREEVLTAIMKAKANAEIRMINAQTLEKEIRAKMMDKVKDAFNVSELPPYIQSLIVGGMFAPSQTIDQNASIFEDIKEFIVDKAKAEMEMIIAQADIAKSSARKEASEAKRTEAANDHTIERYKKIDN